MKKLSRGALIVLEGLDGSGKTTLAKLLAQRMEVAGYPVVLTKEPGATTFGSEIRKILNFAEFPIVPRAELFLYAADRAQHIAEIVKPALVTSKLVISDRMADSTRAYQGFGRNLDKDMIESIINLALDGVKPDLIFYCVVDVDTAQKRSAKRAKLSRFEREDRAFHERVLLGFETLFAGRSDVIRLDMHMSIEEVAELAYQNLTQWLVARG